MVVIRRLNPPGARPWRRAEVTTVISRVRSTRLPVAVSAAMSAWSSPVGRGPNPPAAR
jgi:hypothetical protein